MVVTEGLTERPLPVPTDIPPHEPVYQWITSPVPPPPPFKVRVLFCPLQIVAGEAVAVVGSAEVWFTETVTSLQMETELHGAPPSYRP
jgi:hypothetical protein